MANDDNLSGFEVRPSTEYYFAAFKNAFTHTWDKFLTENQRADIAGFLTNNVTAFAMYTAFSPDGIGQLREQVFTNSNIRDFILGVTSSFYARISKMETEWMMLCERLVNAYSVAAHAQPGEEPDEHQAMPEAIQERIPSVDDVRKFMFGNRWLVVLCMIDQCISPGDILALAPQGKPRK